MNTLRQDSLAGIVVFLVALPLCLGIAQASGLPPFVGLLTGIIGGLVVTALSPSRFAVSGPAAGLVTIVVAAIESLGSFSLFLMALALAGVLQLLFGILRAGRFISLVPASVIKGMLAAIGILLIIQQIPVALGSAEETGLVDIVKGNATFSLSAIAVAAGGLLVLWLWGSPLIRRVKSLRWIPGPLIAVLLGCVTTLLLTHFAPQQLAALPRITLACVAPRRPAGRAGVSRMERVAQSVGVGGGGDPGAGRQPRNPAQPGGAEKAAPAKSAAFAEP